MIYHFTKKSESHFLVDNKSDNLRKNILKSLGVKPSSLYLANSIILVEGVSDLIYFRKYLELYMEQEGETKFIFEKDFAFLEYGGSNIEHWSFLDGDINEESISPNIFIVADGDNELNQEEITNLENEKYEKISFEPNSKKERLIKIYKTKKSYILKVRETENLIKGSILRKTIIEKERRFNQTESNTRDFEEQLIPVFNEKEYKTEYLGTYIDGRMKKFREEKGGYLYSNQNSSGTIKQKNEFSREVIKHMNKYSELTEDAKELTKALYDFIKKSNS